MAGGGGPRGEGHGTSLEEAGWFHAGIPREIAMEILAQQSEGSFVVRESSSQPGYYALSMKAPDGRIVHYLIQSSPGGYCLQVSAHVCVVCACVLCVHVCCVCMCVVCACVLCVHVCCVCMCVVCACVLCVHVCCVCMCVVCACVLCVHVCCVCCVCMCVVCACVLCVHVCCVCMCVVCACVLCITSMCKLFKVIGLMVINTIHLQ